ncbi:hypothetical protein [Microcoleus anatoxicus]|uniref:Uncharacterized protein n=1 Tax=Microcoleus anatoxicus PTRS2 TaxID=2705321 RepID=A0ABU8YPZ9_9CYAN
MLRFNGRSEILASYYVARSRPGLYIPLGRLPIAGDGCFQADSTGYTCI